MNSINIYLFGKFSFEEKGRTINKIEPRKAEERLIYLLLYRSQPQSREHLADILWAEILPDAGAAVDSRMINRASTGWIRVPCIVFYTRHETLAESQVKNLVHFSARHKSSHSTLQRVKFFDS